MKMTIFSKKQLIGGAVCLTIILFGGFFIYSHNNKQININKVDKETSNVTTSENDSDPSLFSYASPNVGFVTGLKEYPSLLWKDKTINEETSDVMIDVNYPQFIGGNEVEKLNQYISDTVKNIIDKDRLELKELVNNTAEYDGGGDYISLVVNYRVIGVTKGVVSIELVTTDFTGGGNGNHDFPYTINWDLKSNRLLKTQELFCSKNYAITLSPIVREEITNYFSSSPHMTQPLGEDMVRGIKSGTDPDADNWKYFLLSSKGLMVVFPPYQVSSGSSGIVRVLIPYSSIPDVVCLP